MVENSNKIKLMKEIVNSSSYKEIDGVIIDIQTAKLIVTIYGKLNDELKKNFTSYSIPKMADIAWRLYEKQQSRLA